MTQPNDPQFGGPWGSSWPNDPGRRAEDSLNPYRSPSQPATTPEPTPPGAVAALICGILSLVLILPMCCCGLLGIPIALLNVGLGVAAVVVGGRELAAIREGRLSSHGEGMARAGRICGYVGIGLNAAFLVVVMVLVTMGALAGVFFHDPLFQVRDVYHFEPE